MPFWIVLAERGTSYDKIYWCYLEVKDGFSISIVCYIESN